MLRRQEILRAYQERRVARISGFGEPHSKGASLACLTLDRDLASEQPSQLLTEIQAQSRPLECAPWGYSQTQRNAQKPSRDVWHALCSICITNCEHEVTHNLTIG